MSGSSSLPAKGLGQAGVYGTQGSASVANVPGGRQGAISWTDSSNNFWLFGGTGIDSSGTYGGLNDLWQFNPTANEWTWISGSNTANAAAVYGTQGAASTNSVPGSRAEAVGWTDKSGNLWIFGGAGNDSAGHDGLLNDLWKFNPTAKTWTWVGGSIPSNTEVGQTGTFAGQPGNYGTLGTASTFNFPGSRYGAVGWTDSNGNFWLFGGTGYDSTGTEGYLNDLWEFSPTTSEWTWVGGSDIANAAGTYGAEGTPAAGNVPGSRCDAVGWTDSNGNLWLFGGTGTSAAIYNDLWEFNTSTKQWMWVSGSNSPGASGTYGTEGTAVAGNVPGSRYYAVGWADSSGNLWLFGGETSNGQMNDLWKFNLASKEWTWVSGTDTAGAMGVYGTLSIPAAANAPGARLSPVSWIDGSGDLWLFGGYYTSTNGTVQVDFNDLWKYQP